MNGFSLGRDGAAAAIVMLVSAVILFAGLDRIRHPIWDEAYYLPSTQRYLEGRAQFASHPPLGLMLIAAGAALSERVSPAEANRLAGEKVVASADVPAAYPYFGLRLASAAFGVVGAGLFFLLMRRLTGSLTAGLMLSGLYVFENAFIVQFRAAHLDAFQVAFALAALLLIVRRLSGDRLHGWEPLALGLACGLAAMVRLNGVFLIVPAALALAPSLWRRSAWMGVGREVVAMSLGFWLAVGIVMTAHVAVARRAPDVLTAAGRRDAAFLSPTYAAYLDGRRSLSPAVVLAASDDYRRFIAADFDGMARRDPNGSRPALWPLHRGAIVYRWDADDRSVRYLRLFGNPVGWMFSLAGLLAASTLLCLPGWADPARRSTAFVILAGFAVFMALHMLLAERRVMYLYHYFPGLLLGMMLGAVSLAELRARYGLARLWKTGAPLFVVAHMVSFLMVQPLTYQRRLSPIAALAVAPKQSPGGWLQHSGR